MKRAITVIFCFAMILSLSACGAKAGYPFDPIGGVKNKVLGMTAEQLMRFDTGAVVEGNVYKKPIEYYGKSATLCYMLGSSTVVYFGYSVSTFNWTTTDIANLYQRIFSDMEKQFGADFEKIENNFSVGDPVHTWDINAMIAGIDSESINSFALVWSEKDGVVPFLTWDRPAMYDGNSGITVIFGRPIT